MAKTGKLGVRLALRMFLIAGIVFGVLITHINTASCATPSNNERARAGDPSAIASLPHSAEKATTYQIVATLVNGFIFGGATGSAVDGLILTTLNTAKSWIVYTANDYAWDAYLPNYQNVLSSPGFEVSQSLWRTTGKVLTYRPVDTALKFALIYYYTQSATIMLASGTASSIVTTGVFYVNNFVWDLYDWSRSAYRPVSQP